MRRLLMIGVMAAITFAVPAMAMSTEEIGKTCTMVGDFAGGIAMEKNAGISLKDALADFRSEHPSAMVAASGNPYLVSVTLKIMEKQIRDIYTDHTFLHASAEDINFAEWRPDGSGDWRLCMTTYWKVLLGVTAVIAIAVVAMGNNPQPQQLSTATIACFSDDVAQTVVRDLTAHQLSNDAISHWAEQNGCALMPVGTVFSVVATNGHVTHVKMDGSSQNSASRFMIGLNQSVFAPLNYAMNH